MLRLSAAAKRAGKSTSTVRRLIKSIAADDEHPDRREIKPSPKEVAKHEREGVQFIWEISEELIDRTYRQSSEKGSASTKESDTEIPFGKLLDTLQHTVTTLETQLDKKDKQLDKRAEEVERLQQSLQHAQMVQTQLAQKAGLPAPTNTIDGEQGSGDAPQEPASIWSTSVNDLVLRLFRR